MDQPTPSQAIPATSPAPEAKPTRPRDRVAGVAGELKARLAAQAAAESADDNDGPAPSAPANVEAKIAAVADKIEAAGGAAPTQRANESDENYELRLSKTLGELKAAKRDAAKHKAEADLSTAEVAKLKKLLDDGKTNPLTILEHLGFDFEKLAKGIADDTYKVPEKRLELPPELQAKIDRLERADKEREANELKARAEAQRSSDVAKVQGFLEANAEDFPLCNAMKWAAANVVGAAWETGKVDVLADLQELEKNLGANLESLMGSDKSIKALIKKNPALKDAILKGLDVSAAPTLTRSKPAEDDDGPRSLSDVSTDPPARKQKMSRADQIKQVAAEWKAKRKAEAEAEDDDEFEDD
jgi:hypothetical protein